jgi:nucleotide-binding universal stress UspA family protein
MPASRFQRIAVATDGSTTAQEAIDIAIDLARTYGAELLVISVAPLPPVYVAPNQPFAAAPPPNEIPPHRELAEAAATRARGAGVKNVRSAVPEGVIVDEVVAQVKAQGTDLLIVGSRGLSTVQRLMLGSVSSALVTHAPCPVLVVRPSARSSSRPPA